MTAAASHALENELLDSLAMLHRLVGNPCPPGVGAAYGEFDGKFWQPAEHGALLLTVGEFAGGDDLIDIIAWRPSQPSRWWFRTGHAAMLGEDAYLASRMLDEALIVHPTPEAWCRAGQCGSCILDGKFRQHLLGLAEIRFSDRAHCRAVRKELARPEHLPRILVRAAA
jgi:hypothetical protein